MGLYTFQCEPCEFADEYFFPICEENKFVDCKKCGKSKTRIFTVPGIKTETRTFSKYFNIAMGIQVDSLADEKKIDDMCKARNLVRGHWDHAESDRREPGRKINDRLAAGGTAEAKRHAQAHRDKLKARNEFRSKKPPPRRKVKKSV